MDIPFVRLLGRDLWEIGGRLVDGKVSRIIFCVDKGRMVLLHGFIKKSRKTPKKDIDLALRRKRERDCEEKKTSEHLLTTGWMKRVSGKRLPLTR